MDIPGLDLDRLTAYLQAAQPDLLHGSLAGEVIAGGRSNLTYRINDGVRSVVLRRPPLGHVLPTAHDMTREFRVIAALHPTGFPVPVPLHLCRDAAVIGAPFYLMSYVDGLVLREQGDLAAVDQPTARRASTLLIQTLADLHSRDPDAVGLGDFGRPDGYLERQVRRWHQQWQHSQTRDLPVLEQAATALATRTPAAGRAAIVHGDYRLDNVIYNRPMTQILAVLDWEMATLGDPLADLGLLVVYTELAAAGLSLTTPAFGPAQGFLSADDLVARYAAAAPGAVPDEGVGWYTALGYYKLAIIAEGIHARFLQGKTVGPGFEKIGAAVPALAARALAALSR